MNQLDDIEFANNHESTCSCILLLDTSASMNGAPIQALNEGLRVFHTELLKDPLARNRVEVAIVTFGHGGVLTLQEFRNITQFEPQTLVAGGVTPMGEAIELSLDMLRQRKSLFNLNGTPYYRPWIFLITDGAPTDAWQAAAERVQSAEQGREVAFFAVGVGSADMQTLSKIVVRSPLKLQGLKFTELFIWLSASQRRVSISKVGESVPLPSADGWAEV